MLGCGLLAAAVASGCAQIKEPQVSYIGEADLSYYEDQATNVGYPLGAEGDPTPVLNSEPPRTISDHRKDEIWDLSLTEALHIALTNSEIIRTRVQNRGTLTSSGLASAALLNPNNIPSIYDPAIQESGVLFGGRGVEAALSAFDAQFTTSMLWGRNAAYQNNRFLSGFGSDFDTGAASGLNPATVLTQETAAFQSGINKLLANGGQVGVYHNWNYSGNNLPSTSQLFRSAYTGATGINFTQPLWAGAGVEFARIAGASNPGLQSITGVSQGVLIARINNDITVANFEIAVRTLLKDVEDVYWNLYLAYRTYNVAVIARNSALRSWREAKAKLEVGGVEGFRPADEAQAKDRYFQTVAQVQTSLNNIYLKEAELRRLMGLPPNDGRVIRPVEEPTTAKMVPDWRSCLTDAMMFRTELRRQKWQIKSLQLQLKAANSLTNPQLNFVSGYQINAFGDDLLASNDNDGTTTQGLGSAYGTLFNGEQTGWNMGLQFSMPIGFRRAKTQVRNLELRLAKAREVLSAQELNVAHAVADALQAIDYRYQNAVANFNRRAAAARRVELFEQELQAGTVTLDEVLRAQASLATAESAYYTSLVRYNQALSYLHVVKGTLLERDNVSLTEGGWEPMAYQQALHKAWHRSHAFDNPFLESVPPPFSIPNDSRRKAPIGSTIPADARMLPAAGQPLVPPAPGGAPNALPTPENGPIVPGAPPVGDGTTFDDDPFLNPQSQVPPPIEEAPPVGNDTSFDDEPFLNPQPQVAPTPSEQNGQAMTLPSRDSSPFAGLLKKRETVAQTNAIGPPPGFSLPTSEAIPSKGHRSGAATPVSWETEAEVPAQDPDSPAPTDGKVKSRTGDSIESSFPAPRHVNHRRPPNPFLD